MRGIIKKIPFNCMGKVQLQPALDVKVPVAFGAAGFLLGIVKLPEDFGPANQLQCLGALEVQKHEAGARIDDEVSERVVHTVPGVVGYPERPVVENSDEAGFAASVGYINAARWMFACHKERIRGSD